MAARRPPPTMSAWGCSSSPCQVGVLPLPTPCWGRIVGACVLCNCWETLNKRTGWHKPRHALPESTLGQRLQVAVHGRVPVDSSLGQPGAACRPVAQRLQRLSRLPPSAAVARLERCMHACYRAVGSPVTSVPWSEATRRAGGAGPWGRAALRSMQWHHTLQHHPPPAAARRPVVAHQAVPQGQDQAEDLRGARPCRGEQQHGRLVPAPTANRHARRVRIAARQRGSMAGP